MGKVYQVYVKGPRGESVTLDVSDEEERFKHTTVGQLKEKVAKRFSVGVGQDNMRLIFLNKSLDEDVKLLSEYGVEHHSLIFFVMTLSGGLTT